MVVALLGGGHGLRAGPGALSAHVDGFMLGVAVLMVVLQRKATTPEDIPAKLAEKVAGKLVKAPEEESESTEE